MTIASGPATGGPFAYPEQFSNSAETQRASLKYRRLTPSLCVTSIPEGHIDDYR
jgi:hypothetical protein